MTRTSKKVTDHLQKELSTVQGKPARTAAQKAAVEMFCVEGSNFELELARVLAGPSTASAVVMNGITSKLFGGGENALDVTATRHALREASDRIKAGDLSDAEFMLYSQSASLNLMFAEMNRRALSALYDGNSFEAGKAYMSIALKAQNQCRMTLETLGNIKNGPMIYARQANVNNGGQQQVNNGTTPRAPATERKNLPNKLFKIMEETIEQRMDTGTEVNASCIDS